MADSSCRDNLAVRSSAYADGVASQPGGCGDEPAVSRTIPESEAMTMNRYLLLGAGFLALLAVGACSNTTNSDAAASCVGPPPDAEIPLPIASANERVDLDEPAFSDPTSVTNPLFPVGVLEHAILLGVVGGETFRAETSVLAETDEIELEETGVEVLVSQYVSLVNRRIAEVALDWYAQADDGSVWYLGEDVFNYEDGVIADFEGTWVACEDGPAAMIMPADPRPGDVYRPENVYPVVFEEVEVLSVGQTVQGPRGPVSGAIVVEELHMDGSTERKTFAPGYGEFLTGSGDDEEALALGLPLDALGGSVPAPLQSILDDARELETAVAAGDWPAAADLRIDLEAAWTTYRAGGQPARLAALMDDELAALAAAVAAHEAVASRHAALGVEQAGLDFLARHESLAEINFLRLDLWLRQLILDSDAGDQPGMASDIALLGVVLARVSHLVPEVVLRSLRADLTLLASPAKRRDGAAVAEIAASMRGIMHSMIQSR
jgi:hypothetical protein